MYFITDQEINALNISPITCLEWVKEAFKLKKDCQLPPKISLHPQGSDFINTMPCLLPNKFHIFGCKIVSRMKGVSPSLKSHLSVIDSRSGDYIAFMECNWITTMRTAAVAALAIQTFKSSHIETMSFIGLGSIGIATLEIILELYKGQNLTIKLMKYKDHAERIVLKYKSTNPNINFKVEDNINDFIKNADVVVSCITHTNENLVEDINLFKPGVLLVPVHTRGFQNCDRHFEKIFADDTAHVSGFKYFNEFRTFGEISDVIQNKIKGRENNKERIISYNIGLGLHDIYFAYKILSIMNNNHCHI